MAQTLIQRSRSKTPVEKAVYHNVAGAGKSRVKRAYFDLDASDTEALRQELDRRVERRLHQQG